MTNTVPTTRLGLKQGGSDNKEGFLLTFGGETLTAFENLNWLRNMTQQKTISGSKGARFPVMGRVKGGRHAIGENLLTPDLNTVGGINAAKNVTFAKTWRDITPDETPFQVSHVFNNVDYLLSPDGAAERSAMAQDFARVIYEQVEVTWFSQVLQDCMSVDSLKSAEMGSTFNDELQDTTSKNWTRRKAVAALKAGLTDSAASTSTTVGGQTFKGNSFGYHIDSLATAAAVRSVLFKGRRNANHLRIPMMGRFAMISSDHYDMLAEAAGLYTGSSGPIVEFSNQINGGGGNVGQVVAPVIAGWALISTPYMTGVAGTGLGSQMEAILEEGATPTTTDSTRYQPAGAPETIAAFASALGNVVTQKMVQHTPGGAGTQPNTWAEWRDLYDKVAIIFGHSSMIGTAHVHELEGEVERHAEVNGDFSVFRYYCGHGNLRPEAGMYVATAKVLTA